MDNKQKNELELDQLEKISGGVEWITVSETPPETKKARTCPFCGVLLSAVDELHVNHCPNAPAGPIIIG